MTVSDGTRSTDKGSTPAWVSLALNRSWEITSGKRPPSRVIWRATKSGSWEMPWVRMATFSSTPIFSLSMVLQIIRSGASQARS